MRTINAARDKELKYARDLGLYSMLHYSSNFV
jgi:hypothetical protein